MAVVRSGPAAKPVAVSSTSSGGAQKSLHPSATALAKTLDWHQRFSSPARVQEYHAAFQAALGSDALRTDFSRALARDFPATAQAVAGGATAPAGGGWVPGGKAARPSADLPTEVAANSLAEALIKQRAKSPIEDVQTAYVAFRGALATEALKSGLDRHLVSCDRGLARELGVI